MSFLYQEPYVFNVFTDASTLPIFPKNPHPITSPGFIAVNSMRAINQDFAIWKGNADFGEMYALFMGINEIYKDAWYQRARGYDPNIVRVYNVFSDSLYSINTIKYWVIEWIKRAGPIGYYWNQYYNMYIPVVPILRKTSDNRPVAHQELILQIVWIILSAQVCIHFYHIKAHLDKRDIPDMLRAREKFSHYSNIPIDQLPLNCIQDMIKWNNEVDNMTRQGLQALVKNSITHDQTLNAEKPLWTMRFYPTVEQMNLYQTLVK